MWRASRRTVFICSERASRDHHPAATRALPPPLPPLPQLPPLPRLSSRGAAAVASSGPSPTTPLPAPAPRRCDAMDPRPQPRVFLGASIILSIWHPKRARRRRAAPFRRNGSDAHAIATTTDKKTGLHVATMVCGCIARRACSRAFSRATGTFGQFFPFFRFFSARGAAATSQKRQRDLALETFFAKCVCALLC